MSNASASQQTSFQVSLKFQDKTEAPFRLKPRLENNNGLVLLELNAFAPWH